MGVAKVILNGDTLIDVTQKTVSESNLLSGITALGADGENVIGTYIAPTFSTQSKSAVPSESAQSIFPDNGYDGLSRVDISAISSTYVGTGIERQSSQTITPTTTNQSIFSGKYLTGNQTILGDANLIPANIAEGVSIFGVNGTHSGGGGEDHTVEDGIIQRTLSGYYSNSRVTSVWGSAFASCTLLTEVAFPNVTTIGYNAFNYCTSLSKISFPMVDRIYSAAFQSCFNLESAILPNLSYLPVSIFHNCSSLSYVSAPVASRISGYAFFSCKNLLSVYAPMVAMISSSAFYNCISLQSLVVRFSSLSSIGSNAFYSCSHADLTSITTLGTGIYYIDASAFQNCQAIKEVVLPKISRVNIAVFSGCSAVSRVIMASASTVETYGFMNCTSLEYIAFGKSRNDGGGAFISTYAFKNCQRLTSVYLLRRDSVVYNLVASNTFDSTPIGGYSQYTDDPGKIYVWSGVYEQYLSHSIWALYSSKIVSLTTEEINALPF